MSIFIILIFSVSAMLNNIFVQSNQQLLSMSNIDQARSTLIAFTNEIRNSIIGSDGSYPLNQAGDSQIIFFSNYKSSTTNRIRYYISGSTLYKGITLPTGSPAVYNTSFEKISTVATGVSNATSPIFYYYDGAYTGTSTALAQPVNINNVRFIKINLSVLSQAKLNSTGTFSISAGAAVRSVKDNLGN